MRSDATLLLLDKSAVEQLLDPDDVIAAVRKAFTLHSQRAGRVFPVVRESLPSGGIFGIKSGDVPSQALLGFKAAGSWPGNRALGGEPHQAKVLLFDPATGRPHCVNASLSTTASRPPCSAICSGRPKDTPCEEIGALLAGDASFDRLSADITVFDMTGLALQDLSVARLIYPHTRAEGLGHRIAWPR
jgi:ornithine cyclodeaminase/alanine dehydrogenase-like protein (mu-crystallin family)